MATRRTKPSKSFIEARREHRAFNAMLDRFEKFCAADDLEWEQRKARWVMPKASQAALKQRRELKASQRETAKLLERYLKKH